jgi:hypothetical protein
MRILSEFGRIFFGIFIAIMGFTTIYFRTFPYMLIPPQHVLLTMHYYLFGALLVLAGLSIIFAKWVRPVSMILGGLLLLIFCFLYIPFQLETRSHYIHFGAWENAAKELALAGGAFLIAACYQAANRKGPGLSPAKLAYFGEILFALPIISFGINHFLYIQAVKDYEPAWVTHKIFWGYLAGLGLLASGLAILVRIQVRLAALLLGIMVFIWFVILHVPRVVEAPASDMDGEFVSAFLALAYAGTAFFIAGNPRGRT